jgi:4-hydroxy-4-methyl-2-oxoglutarate aldolase
VSDARLTKGSAGLMADSQIRPQPRRIPKEVIDRFLALDDLAGTVSDALDQLGIIGVIGASTLPPNLIGKRAVGTAVTLRNVPQKTDPHLALTTDLNLMSEIEAIHQTEPGDVLVIQGVPEVSNMGGIIATICTRQKLAGAVVDGGIRDVNKSRALGFTIWSRHITPLTGKWRVISTEVNGTITVAGMTVRAGDLVVADETGICFVPQERVAEVLALCEATGKKEAGWVDDLGRGISIPDIMPHLYKNLPNKK